MLWVLGESHCQGNIRFPADPVDKISKKKKKKSHFTVRRHKVTLNLLNFDLDKQIDDLSCGSVNRSCTLFKVILEFIFKF